MEISIFIIYLVFFSFLITIIPFFKTSGIGKFSLIALFVIKVFAGVAYAKFYRLPKYYAGADTWRFYRFSIAETKWLLHNPAAFIKDVFTDNYSKSGNLFSGQNSYWNDLKSNVVIKLLAAVNVFTNNSYYADVIFFNFLFLFGLIALFRLFYQLFPQKKGLIIAGIFLLPSTLFWCSGIHKDGLILSATGLIIYTFSKGLKSRFTFRGILVIFLCMLITFSLRNFIFFALIPSLFAWLLCEKYSGKNMLIFTLVYLSAIVFCIIIFLIFPSVNMLLFVTNKQHEFLLLEGGSKIKVPTLAPTIMSFISFIPYAADMAFFRPHINEFKNISYAPAIIENTLFLLLVVVTIFSKEKKEKSEPVILFLFFFSISIILLTGYTIPFAGAVVRYKSLVLPLVITPLLCFGNFFNLNKKKFH